MFGNALGNAAIGEIKQQNAATEQKQQSQTSLFGILSNAAQNDPKLAYMLGPYGSRYSGGYISDQTLADYETSGLPLLASADPESTYAAVHGPASESSDYLTLSAPNGSTMDDRWSFVAQVKQNGGPTIDPTQISQQEWNDYVHDYSHLGQVDPNAITLGTIEVTGQTFAPASSSSQDELAFLGVGQTPELSMEDVAQLQEIAEGTSDWLDASNIVAKGTAQFGALGILNRAGALQQDRMTSIARATSFEDFDGVLGYASKSGQWSSKFSTASKFIEPLGVAANAVYLYADVRQAPPDQVPLVIARDTTSFAGEALAATGGAEVFAAFGAPISALTGPFAPFTEAAFTVAGGLVGLGIYNLTPMKGDVKDGVSLFVNDSVNGVEKIIQNPHMVVDEAKSSWDQFKSDAKYTAAYLEYLLSNPKGPYGQ